MVIMLSNHLLNTSSLTLLSCRCGAQFCYVCGTKWRACECEQYVEDQLLDADCRHEGDWVRWDGPHVCTGCGVVSHSFIEECQGCQLQPCSGCLNYLW